MPNDVACPPDEGPPAAPFGALVRVLPHVHAFGEVTLRYSATRGEGQPVDRVS